MTILPDDLDKIGVYIKSNLPIWMGELQIGHDPASYEIEMRERIVRVEEELRHQRELMQQGFQQMDKRFEQVIDQMNKRFEQVDKRFEQADKRFESLTRRIDRFMIWSFGLTVTVGGVVIAVLKFG
jgi:predicted RNase H-like nuclease (RuvC/YqgF family)